MGMYTCLKFTGMIKKDFEDEMKNLLNTEIDYNWRDFAKKYPFAEEFSELPRADFIPFGAITPYNEDKVGCENPKRSIIAGDDSSDPYGYRKTLVFTCDLKNYDDEIEEFIEEVAVNIFDKFIAEKWYEEFAFPTIYFYDGKELKIF